MRCIVIESGPSDCGWFSAVKLKSTMAGVADFEKWIAVETPLGYLDQHLHEFVKEQQILKREERPRKRDEEKAEREAQHERKASKIISES